MHKTSPNIFRQNGIVLASSCSDESCYAVWPIDLSLMSYFKSVPSINVDTIGAIVLTASTFSVLHFLSSGAFSISLDSLMALKKTRQFNCCSAVKRVCIIILIANFINESFILYQKPLHNKIRKTAKARILNAIVNQ